MKHFTFIVFFTFITFTSSAQCKYLVNETDAFTGTSKLETYPVLVYNFQKRLDLRFIKLDDERYLFAHLTIPASDIVFVQGNEMILLFNDDSTHKLTLSGDHGKDISAGTTSNVGGMLHSQFGLYYHFSEDDRNILQDKQLKGVRFYGAETYVEIPVAQTAAQWGGAGKNKKEAALMSFFSKDVQCVF